MFHLKIHLQKSCQTVKSLIPDTSPYWNFPDELVCLSDLLTKGHDEGIHFRTIGQDILGLRDLAAQHEIAVSISDTPGVGFQKIIVKPFNRLR